MNKIKLILSTFKSFKTFRKEFWFKKNLSAKVFQILIPKTMKGEISQPSRALELWRGEFCFKWIFCTKFLLLYTNFSLPISLYLGTPFAMKTMVVFIKKWECQRVKEGWKGLLFCPHQLSHVHANHALSPFTEKKTKKVQKVVQGHSAGRYCVLKS